jgi:hypothetical protein
MSNGTPKPVGYAIGAATLLAFVGGITVAVRGCVLNQPKVWVEDVGMHNAMAELASTSTRTWPGMGANIEAIHKVLTVKYPAADSALRRHLWLELYALTATITSPTVPTGEVKGSDGKLHEINGTINATAMEFAFFGPKNYIALVRWLPGGACRSAFTHEVAQHIVPFVLENDLNFFHEGQDLPANDPRHLPANKLRWIPLDIEITKACVALLH